MKIVVTGFLDTLPKAQRRAGYVYLPFHILILPLLLAMLAQYLPDGLSDSTASLIYYSIGLLFCAIVMWRYLRSAFDILLDNFMKNLFALFFAYFICLMLSYLAAGLQLAVMGDTAAANPNEQALDTLKQTSPGVIIGLSVFFAPIVEELLFRGVLFGSLRVRHRALAFVVSIGLFAFYHVWQYAFSAMDARLFIYMLQYIPAGYALAWLYEKTNCIWMPIFLHMAINLMSVTAAY